MTELEAYRQHVLASPKACKALVSRAVTDADLEAMWGDPMVLGGALRIANRLTAPEIASLIAPMLDAPARPIHLEQVRMIAAYA
ncbi:hypothetical protein SAMN06297129_3534 [Pseudooceanicola antarcticus]|uniref:Uncharacterized protein n=1 Tax=Pseudooceanicola antarcticus TaxID=1247613 RepID=A0A285JD16_9RHOB|nr:hypothetical protein [Pseudooceanicola antarcticus]PJE31352.1 hypothetical protein CVM39_03855 [Pseudooceanicola antarcticus]SNY58169.1 hypothetical protein SAMN06297129_3534 [Pseudooceanicola antarcticus]